jgi:protein TonB
METKKTPGADLEKERTTFFLVGFAVVLSTFFVLMEWQSPDSDFSGLNLLNPVFIENEFTGNIESPGILNEQPENPIPETIEKTDPETVFEDYNIVAEVNEVEETPYETPAQLTPDSSVLIPEERDNPVISENQPLAGADIHSQAEIMPQFPGGQVALIQFIYKNIQYPPVALKQRIQGKVWCSFVVDKDGSVSNIRLEEGVYIFLDEEAIRVLGKMPQWIPGQNAGKNIRVKVYLPIVFKL